MLANKKREAFAQAMAVNECSGAEAYRRHVSGGKCSARTAEVSASDLLRPDSEVALRVGELRKVAAGVAERKFGLNRSTWLCRLLSLADGAEAAGEFSAAVGCLREIGKAMRWYEPEAEDRKILVVIGRPGDR